MVWYEGLTPILPSEGCIGVAPSIQVRKRMETINYWLPTYQGKYECGERH